MNIIEHLQRLDALIVEHTKPPVTAMLRRELSFATEQCEAYQASSDKQDQTLERQAQTIAALQDQNKQLIATIAKSQAQDKQKSDDWWREKAERHQRMIQSKRLRYYT